LLSDLGHWTRQLTADRSTLLWLLLITLAGTALRLWFLDQPIRYDEAHTWHSFVMPGSGGPFSYREPNNHVAHSLLASLSTTVFGSQPWALRLPAFLAGVLLVPATFVCARTVFKPSRGLFAAGLAAGSPYLVLFSSNARGYSGIALITLLLAPLTLYAVRKESSFAWFLVALLSALGLYTIPIMVFPMVMLAAWALLLAYQTGGKAKILRLSRALALTLLLCMLFTLLLYLPVIRSYGPGAILANRYVRPQALGEALAEWPRMARETWQRFFRDIPLLGKLLLVGCMLVGMGRLWRANRSALLLVLAAPLCCALIMLVTRTLPYQRTWIFLLPLAYCLADTGLTGLVGFPCRNRWVHLAGALGLLFALGMGYHLITTDAVTHYPDTGALPDAQEIVDCLEPNLQEGDWVLVRRFWPLRYYGQRVGIPLATFSKSGSKDTEIYVLVQLPGGTFESVVRKNYAHLNDQDYVTLEFPTSRLYVPKTRASGFVPCR
jgi:4-amino-4-deoxy-L-arabinose transferase-like glycosyltransferase